MKIKFLKGLKLFVIYLKRCVKPIFRYIIALRWVTLEFGPFKKHLYDKNKVVKMRPFKMHTWHMGHRYFVGKLESQKPVFIKTGGKYRLITNEIVSLKRVARNDSDFSVKTPQVLGYETSETYDYMILEFLNGIPLNEVLSIYQLSYEQKSSIINQLFEMVLLLDKSRIIHRDIRPENIMVSYDRKGNVELTLIDFSFALVKDQPCKSDKEAVYPDKTLRTLGGNFKPSFYVWDDAYSILLICSLVDTSFKKDFFKIWQELNIRMGVNQYTVRDGALL